VTFAYNGVRRFVRIVDFRTGLLLKSLIVVFKMTKITVQEMLHSYRALHSVYRK
jgi:hypothetical protein